MKLLDANILLYAYDRSSTHHETCRAWLEALLNSDEIVALPWQTILAFVRIATNPKATRNPLSGPAACTIAESWIRSNRHSRQQYSEDKGRSRQVPLASRASVMAFDYACAVRDGA